MNERTEKSHTLNHLYSLFFFFGPFTVSLWSDAPKKKSGVEYQFKASLSNKSEVFLTSSLTSWLSCLQLSRDCKVEVQRILHQRALDVKLDPELQRRCMTDLGKWCSEKTEAGQELECLQDHLEDLVSDCRDVVGNLTELESEVTTRLLLLLLPIMQHYHWLTSQEEMHSGMFCVLSGLF